MSELADRIKQIDNGRFIKIIDALGVNDYCMGCAFFDKSLDKGRQIRCHSIPRCIDATLSAGTLSYIQWKLGMKTQEQHMKDIKNE